MKLLWHIPNIARSPCQVWFLRSQVTKNVGLSTWVYSLQVRGLHAVVAERSGALCMNSVKIKKLIPVKILEVVTVDNSNNSA